MSVWCLARNGSSRRKGACIALLWLGGGTARAEARPSDSALAHDLFDQGRALMEQKDYSRACKKFEDSRRLEVDGGGGTVLNLALCSEALGKTGTAWAEFPRSA